MDTSIDFFFRVCDRIIGAEVASLPEPFAHVVAFLLVSLGLGLAAVVLACVGAAVSQLSAQPGLAMFRTSFRDMVRTHSGLAKVNWWAAYPESLVTWGFGPPDSPNQWERFPDRRPRSLRLAFTVLRLLGRVLRLVLTFGRLALPRSWASVFAWLVVIAYLDPELLRQITPEALIDAVRSRGKLLPGLITIASAVLAVAFALRRPRIRALAAHRLARDQDRLEALARMLQSAHDVEYELWKLGSQGVGNLRHELSAAAERVSGGECWLGPELEVKRRPAHLNWNPASCPEAAWPDHGDLRKAVGAIECERDKLEDRGERAALSRLVGRAGAMRLTTLLHPDAWEFDAREASGDAVRDLIEGDYGLASAKDLFDQARQERSKPLAERAQSELEESVRNIAHVYRRQLAAIAKDVAEIAELCFRLGRRRRLGPVDRIVAG